MTPEHQKGLTFSIREGLCIEHKPEPCGIVIFGASGDLTSRKLLPSIAYLSSKGLLPKRSFVLGVARTALSPDEFRARAKGVENVYYMYGSYENPDFFLALKARLQELDARHETGGRLLFHLAVPPPLYPAIVEQLGRAGLLEGCVSGGCSRVVIEKPFGRDLESARALDAQLKRRLREEQVYRIDHYLGKETVQNVLMFRFANAIFEPVWNRTYVDHVQISVLENAGVEHRAGYYDGSGVVRDMFQNHMLMLLALIAMEPPASFEADRVRDEVVKVFRNLRPLAGRDLEDHVVLGQYEGYRLEPGVASSSSTPTFAAMRLDVDDWRWSGVPFYLRSGKRLCCRSTEVAVVFKQVPHSLFSPLLPEHLAENALVFRIQPNEGISLTIEAKKPGPKICLGALTMDFDYAEAFGERPPEAYQRLLLDAMLGDPTLFLRQDAVEETWRFCEPLLKTGDIKLEPYATSSEGPEAAQRLIARFGRRWR
ncbi:MAG TPA: glucose-6-phosphate dehydrogenase [Elusimicrobia bacterium]|nr:glucose-6-phosphate dehydrogenase [Elusimicrobiota bacterium]